MIQQVRTLATKPDHLAHLWGHMVEGKDKLSSNLHTYTMAHATPPCPSHK